ncbi:MAG: beta-mannosidase [Barnesiella sp.]|nr:beta-mannosidase [Barnesiella sp.]
MNKALKIAFSLMLLPGGFTAYSASQYLHTPDAQWKLCPADEVSLDEIVDNGYDASAWVDAIVPGTAFTAYVVAGKEQDPNFGDNIYNVDRKKYDRSMAYRTNFSVPQQLSGNRLWLNFDGINRRGTVYLNGRQLGVLDGFMHRGRFDVTDIARRDGDNTLVVIVDLPQQPLANQGSPNYLSSAGWDWMPYVPGLNSGLTDKVWISDSGDATIVDPWIRTARLTPSHDRAELTVETGVKNSGKEKKRFTVKGTITPGDITFEKEVEVEPGYTATVEFDKRYFPQLSIKNPDLWWPNGYGDPNLYNCHIEVLADGKTSQEQDVTFGIRKYSYDKNDGVLHIKINDTPVFVKGGNWGMSEYMLRARGQEDYDTRIALHKEMNFNMIRNWLGSVTDEEFYDACDRNGIMVWDDFWINSNPNIPYDLNAFNNNVMEKIKRLRNHAAIAVWCGDNEAHPLQPIDDWMATDIAAFDGGDRMYQPRSNAEGLSGSGSWGAFDPRHYFTPYPNSYAGSDGYGSWGFRTEIGTAVVPTYTSLVKFMPDDHLWPIDDMWNKHFFGQLAFNADPDGYVRMLTENWGEPTDAADFCKKGQLLNYESNKAMYEGWIDHMWDDASGIMTWMSQSAYPSMVWQTYDYYFDPTGAYWGCKSACEPVHIYWNPVSNAVRVANTTSDGRYDLTAEARVYNLDGKEVKRYTKSAKVNSASNKVTDAFTLDFNTDRDTISLGKTVTASSTKEGQPGDVADGNSHTRWAAEKRPGEWITIDLGEKMKVGGVRLNWEAAYAKKYKVQVSENGHWWRDVVNEENGEPGIAEYFFNEADARYVRMQGVELGNDYGYSLWDFDVYGAQKPSEGLDDTHFINLQLKDNNGALISENNYWRGHDRKNFQAVNSMPKANLKVKDSMKIIDGKAVITATITNPRSARSAAFAVHAQPVRNSDGERLLPAIESDNYFTLMPGQSKTVTFTFSPSLLDDSGYTLKVEPYNN